MKTLSKIAIMATIIPSALAGIIEPNVLWDKKELKTCFYSDESQLALTHLKNKKYTKENFDFSPKKLRSSQKKTVINTIVKEYTPEKTGIYFTGFQDCKNVKNPDVIVIRAASKIVLINPPGFNGMGVMGQDGELDYRDYENEGENSPIGFYRKSGKAAYIALKSINEGTIVHEFGHVAGLRHEHIREDAAYDKQCASPFSGYPTKEVVYDTAHFETQYDSKSIMNYCYLKTQKSEFKSRIGNILSQGDKATLKAFYP